MNKPFSVAIAGGKGGVGKTLLASNLAVALNLLGYKVLTVDLNFDNPNLITHLGSSYEQSAPHIAYGVSLIEPSEDQLELLPSKMANNAVDFIIYDFSSRHCPKLFNILLNCDYKILVTTPELTSIEGLHRFTKGFLNLSPSKTQTQGFQLLVNQIRLLQDRDILYTLPILYKNFLSLNLSPLDSVNYERIVPQSLKQRVPPIVNYPGSEFASVINQVAKSLARTKKSHLYNQEAIGNEGP